MKSLTFSLWSYTAILALSAPQITEFVAINASSLVDGDGAASDWIEIHNPDAGVLNLSGYLLSDDPDFPAKYSFPAGTSIAAGQYLVVFASGRSEANYTDAGGNLHTNFSLSGSGEYLSLRHPNGSLIQELSPEYPAQAEDISYGIGTSSPVLDIVTSGAPATWLAPSSDIGDSWQTPGFNDATWTPCETAIGYGSSYGDFLGSGGNTSEAMWFGNPSVYLRVPFELSSPLSSLTLKMRYDDGFVAYLNGVRVASANAPAEASLAYNSTATEAHQNADAIVPVSFPLPTASLVTGTNVLAIHGLNLSSAGSGSSDFFALPELIGAASGVQQSYGYFTTPTPGQANGPIALLGFVEDTKFSHKRGYYEAAFDLSITTATAGATVIYTTDGTEPTETNGMIYTGPITISSTTALRAIAIKTGFLSTNIDTQTYLFVDDIVRQTRPAGYPTTWGGAAADYDMDADVVDDPAYAAEFGQAFAALPTLSLVFDPASFFDSSTGIYQNPGQEGIAWERPTSAELILADGSEPGFQIDAGVRIQGGSSRNTDTPKHSLSLRFRSVYGAGKLNYPLFENSPQGDSAVEQFDALQLRPEYNFGWMHRHWYQCDHALYGRDQWASDLFLKMGQNGSHGRWTHLFLNGIYWGLYDMHERPDADHMANYFGGSDDDYDTVNSSVATNGDLVAYNAMMDIAYGDIASAASYAAIQEYLDLDAFIDYMILNGYIGNRDWDGHNWRAARKREAGAPYLFFAWDSEFAASHVAGGVFPNPPNFESTTLSTNVLNNNGNRRPTGLQQRLELNTEYRIRYADRVRAHFFNGGPMEPAQSEATWTTRAIPMSDAIVAESARWGDFRRDVSSASWTPADFDLYTRDDYYQPMNTWLTGTYIPQRTAIVLAQMRTANLYPNTAAPDFSQHGGDIAMGSNITLSGPSTIYYTTDGSDPRNTGGAINPAAITIANGQALSIHQSLNLQARARATNGEWSALTQADFTVGFGNLIISEIMYHPSAEPLAEFLEITNTGTASVALTGLHFTNGITFDFDLHSSLTSLAPGASLLIVKDVAAFQSIYGNAQNAIIAGTFQEDSSLSNSGERLTLSDANGVVIFTVRYRDGDDWSTEPDGAGPSLVYAGGDPESAQSWRPSSSLNGNPGSSDSTPYLSGSLLDYALVGQPTLLPSGFSYTTQLTADDAIIEVQHSADLETWVSVDLSAQTQVLNAVSGTRSFTLSLPGGMKGFARVIVTLK